MRAGITFPVACLIAIHGAFGYTPSAHRTLPGDFVQCNISTTSLGCCYCRCNTAHLMKSTCRALSCFAFLSWYNQVVMHSRDWSIHIFQDCFADTETISRTSLYNWSDLERYRQIRPILNTQNNVQHCTSCGRVVFISTKSTTNLSYTISHIV